MAMPQAPMPPPPPPMPAGAFPVPGAFEEDAWQANPAMVLPDEPLQGRADFDPLDDAAQYTKPKKNKKHGAVEAQLKGYMLHRAPPLPGEKPNWARVGKCELPFDEAKLEQMVKNHRSRTRSGPVSDFRACSSNQQGIITRLIAEHKRLEKQSNADWILYDVERFGKWRWQSYDVKKIQVILKRQDVNSTKPSVRVSSTPSSFQFGEIIDLADPLIPKKKKKAFQQDDDERLDSIDPHGPSMPVAMPEQDYYPQREPQVSKHYPPFPQYTQPAMLPAPPEMPEAPNYPPPGAIPVPDHMLSTPQHHQASYQPENPFIPHAHPAVHGQYDPHYNDDPLRPRNRVFTRSDSPRRRRSSSARRTRGLQVGHDDIQEGIDDVTDKIDNWHLHNDSSDGHRDNDSIFSPPPSGGSFTPASTPPLPDDDTPRGSLYRSKSNGARRPDRRYDDERHYSNQRHYSTQRRYSDERRYNDDRRYDADQRYDVDRRYDDDRRYNDDRRYSNERRYGGEQRYREDRRYRDERVEIRPGHSYGSRQKQYRDDRRRYDYAPRLQRSQTYDDYPTGRGADLRDGPAGRMQRRLTDFSEVHPRADYDEDQRRRRRSTHDPYQEQYARRRSVAANEYYG